MSLKKIPVSPKRVFTFLAFIALATGITLWSSGALAAPAVSWNPRAVSETIQPGQTRTISLTLTALKSVPSASFRVVPSLQRFVRVAPTTIGPLQKGQTAQIALILSAGIDALPITASGTVQLRRTGKSGDLQGQRQNNQTGAQMNMGNENENNDDGNMIAQPLPVNVGVVWPRVDNLPGGISFSYPTFGYANGQIATEEPITDGKNTWTVYDVNFATPDLTSSIMLYHITVLSNTQYRSIQEWFTGNIDPNGILAAARSFEFRQLPNGFQSLVLTGKIPTEFGADNGPIDGIFAMSSSTKTVVIVGRSLAGSAPLGYDKMQQSFVTMLGTMQVP